MKKKEEEKEACQTELNGCKQDGKWGKFPNISTKITAQPFNLEKFIYHWMKLPLA